MKREEMKPRLLNATSRAFLKVLLDRAEHFRFKSRRRYSARKVEKALMTYKELVQAAGFKTRGIGGIPYRKVGQYLGPIADFCKAYELPCLNTLVVNGKTREPGYNVLTGDGTRHWAMEAVACLYVKFDAELFMQLSLGNVVKAA